MVRMSRQRIYFKNSGVLHDIVIKFFHTLTQKGPETQRSRPSLSFKTASKQTFAASYLTEPVIPSANCFCRMKKTSIVGMEQNRTPIIRTP